MVSGRRQAEGFHIAGFIMRAFCKFAVSWGVTALIGWGIFQLGVSGGPWFNMAVSQWNGKEGELFTADQPNDAPPQLSDAGGTNNGTAANNSPANNGSTEFADDYQNDNFFFAQAPGSRGIARYPRNEGKNETKIKEVFKPVVAPAVPSTVQVLCDEKPVALGTIMTADGEILTKASELSGMIFCKLKDGRTLPATVDAVSRDYDLALLKVEDDKLTPIDWRTSEDPALGSFLATVGQTEEPVAIGVLSVTPRKINKPKGVLGIVLTNSETGAKIESVTEGGAAELAGLKANDIISKINELEVKSKDLLRETLTNYQPGDRLQLQVKRGNDVLEIYATLGRMESIMPQGAFRRARGTEERLAGKLSERRDGFPRVFQHDTVLRPNQVGGPIVDLDGKGVGVNIARADRVATYAIPVSVVKSVFADLKGGKLPAPAELRGDNYDRLQAKVKRLQQSASEANAFMVAAEQEFKKAQVEAKKVEDQLAKAKKTVSERETAFKKASEAEKKSKSDLKVAEDMLRKLESEKIKVKDEVK
jgi:serine protease Do